MSDCCLLTVVMESHVMCDIIYIQEFRIVLVILGDNNRIGHDVNANFMVRLIWAVRQDKQSFFRSNSCEQLLSECL